MSGADDPEVGVRLDVRSESPISATSSGPPSPKKRKAEDISEAVPKKRKKRKGKKDRGAENGSLDVDAGVDTAFARMDGRLLADFVAQRTKRFESDLSMIELEDNHIPERAFRDTSTWQKPRNLEALPDYLKQFSKSKAKATDLAKAPANPGSPHTIVVTGAGLRAAELTRSLRKFQGKNATVAKLFAKHIKLKEAEKFLRSMRTNIAVGTPSRLLDLLNNNALSSGSLERIVVDASHIDQKKRGMFDMREVFLPLLDFLNHDKIKPRYLDSASGGRIELLFF